MLFGGRVSVEMMCFVTGQVDATQRDTCLYDPLGLRDKHRCYAFGHGTTVTRAGNSRLVKGIKGQKGSKIGSNLGSKQRGVHNFTTFHIPNGWKWVEMGILTRRPKGG